MIFLTLHLTDMHAVFEGYLGLANASQLTNKNGWTIELEPRKGGGTVAKLELPALV